VAEARERLAAIDTQVKAIDERVAARVASQQPVETKIAALVKRSARRPIIKAEPQGEFALAKNGLAVYHLSWGGGAPEGASAKAIAGVVLAGEKITFGSGGVSLSVKGAAQRTRYVDQATVRRLDALNKKAEDCERRAREARQAWKDAKAAYYRESPYKVTPEEIATMVGQGTVLLRQRRDATSMSEKYQRERLVERERPTAQRHLDHVLSKSKDPCPCETCEGARRRATWAAQAEANQRAKEAKEREREKQLAKAPRVSFTCPSCGMDSISPIFPGTGEVECQSERCGDTAIASAIRFKRVAKTTPIGLIGIEEVA
jgi:hypothetical protein